MNEPKRPMYQIGFDHDGLEENWNDGLDEDDKVGDRTTNQIVTIGREDDPEHFLLAREVAIDGASRLVHRPWAKGPAGARDAVYLTTDSPLRVQFLDEGDFEPLTDEFWHENKQPKQ